jgi:type IX secretion system PorP/SprF family membrane protein
MKSRLTLLCLLLVTLARAQDKHFTQFYASPLTLNPALTGGFEGRYRVGTIYRDQWRRVLDNPIRTFALAADLRFDAPGAKIHDDAIGLGLLFFTDRVSVVDFSTTQIAISGAYHKALDSDNSQFLTLGIQGGLTQRNVNYESLDFHDEFNLVNGYSGSTQEALPPNNFSFGDWNVGLNYSLRLNRGGLFAGAALHHFGQPRVSFYENQGPGDRLYMKISGQLAADVPIGRTNRVALQPRALFAVQGPHFEVNAGTNIRFALGEYGYTALHVGSWVRPVRNNDGVGIDAVVALLGLEYNNVLLGLSYDLNLRALQYNQRQGAFEISIAYLGNYENEDILCPKF